MYSKWNSIFLKLISTFFVLILPLYGLSVWLTFNSSGQMREEIERSYESVLLYHYSNLEFELGRINSMLVEYSLDGELADFSTMAPIMSNYEIDRRLNNIFLKISQMKSSSPYMEDVRYYIPSLGKLVSVRGGITNIPASEWRGLLASNAHIPGTISEYQGSYYLGKSTPELLGDADAPNFLLVAQLSTKELTKQLRAIRKEGHGGAFLAFGALGSVIVSDETLREEFGSYIPLREEAANGNVVRTESEDGYYYSTTSRSYDFELVTYITKDVLLKPIQQYTGWMRSLTVVSCVLILVFTYGIYQLIQQPLLKLIRGFRAMERGRMNQIDHRRGDEFGYLYNQFNIMQQRLHALIEDNYVQRIRMQDAELKHLQSQISPHFLYNSLFTIKQMAELENTEDIKLFSEYLGQYFRFMTRDFNKEVPLANELEHSLAYLHIQEIRFSNRIRVETELPEKPYLSIMVPRIILQPVLENVFNHGLVQKAEKGVLKVSWRADETMLAIVVEDNGDALTDERLRSLQNKLENVSDSVQEGETTGLMNVHHRLRIRFGPPYGLALSRSSLGGLKTEIRLPLHQNGKESESHVSIDDRG